MFGNFSAITKVDLENWAINRIGFSFFQQLIETEKSDTVL